MSARIRLPDGTSWPDARGLGALVEAIGNSDLDKDAQQHLFAIIEAYEHIALHPVGTEAVLKKVRMLRKVLK